MPFGFDSGRLFSLAVILAAGVATAQTMSGDASSQGYGSFGPAPGVATGSGGLSAVLTGARNHNGGQIRAAMDALNDPIARKIAMWALADSAPEYLSFPEADQARRDLAAWPRPARRQAAAERALPSAGMAPAAVIAWFGGTKPETLQGAAVLAGALQASGDAAPAGQVISTAWRSLVSDQATQDGVLARFGPLLTAADHAARADLLLYGAQGPAAQDMVRLLPPDQQAIAQARLALRRGDPGAQGLVDALPPAAQQSPGIAYERILRLRDAGQTTAALALVRYLPESSPNAPAAERLWKKGSLVTAALRAGDSQAAYDAAAHSGLARGSDAAEADFYAGWIALTRLKDPRLADTHFAHLQEDGRSPLTLARAFYWRGRAAEALGDPVAAQLFYSQGAQFPTAFYGQLAAARSGVTTLALGGDPVISPSDQARFEARDEVKAARMIYQNGDREAFRAFVGGLSEVEPDAASEAMLVDIARGYGEQEIAMRIVRNAARRGIILPERGYPLRTPPLVPEAPEPAFILGVTRQESSFDPNARSGAGARGMMQLMPATAQVVARRLGLGSGSLEDPDYNMRVGGAFLGQLVEQFSGSYLMAAAAYNAGPGRPTQWVAFCGDPRGSSTDPVDFIECIPFSETRDYVMRVMEATEVYRARLKGGSAPLTLAQDLKRGSYGYASAGPFRPGAETVAR